MDWPKDIKEVHIHSQQIKPSPCPSCKNILDAATGVGEGLQPTAKPGAVTVCAYCQALLVFTNEMQLRFLKQEELDAMPERHRKMMLSMSEIGCELFEESPRSEKGGWKKCH